MNFDSYFRSDIGQKRTNNEDFARALEPSDAQQLIHSGRLYVVADGLGGHRQGEKASAHAVNTLLQLYYQNPKLAPEQRLRDIIVKINRDLIAYAQKNLPGEKVATTIVAAVVRENSLLVANVGDSRAYLLRNGEIAQITRDHSYVGEMLRTGVITEVEAQQSKLKNRLTRSLGSAPDVEVDVYPLIPLLPGDIFLLCSDGLTQYATRQDLATAMQAGSARKIGERLIQFANARGGSDNITVAVVKVGSPLAGRKRDKTSKPGGKPLKTIAAIVLGVLMLAVFSLLGWYWYTSRITYTQATPTPTTLPTLTLEPTLTPEPTQTFLPSPSDTAMPQPSVTPGPLSLVDCEYIVQPGDNIERIEEIFSATLDQIFRGDENLKNPDVIITSETLTIKGILAEMCLNGGGKIQSQPSPVP